MKVKRHPIRAFLGGLLLGLGISILLVTYAKIAFGRPTFIILTVAVAVVSLLLALFIPPRGQQVEGPTAPDPV